MAVFIDDDRLPEGLFKGLDDADVLRHAALEDDGLADALALADVVQIIADDGLAEPGDDVLLRVADLNLVDQVGFGEDGTSRRDVGRVGRLQRHLAHILYRNAETARLG